MDVTNGWSTRCSLSKTKVYVAHSSTGVIHSGREQDLIASPNKHICQTGKIKWDAEASNPGWRRERNRKVYVLSVDAGGNARACCDLGNFRINIALGERPAEGDPSRVVTHAFSQQLI